MTPEMKDSLLRYYAEQAELSVSHRHKAYNQDMIKFLNGETNIVRYAESQAKKYIYSSVLDMTFDNWQEASQVLKRPLHTLYQDFLRTNKLGFKVMSNE